MLKVLALRTNANEHGWIFNRLAHAACTNCKLRSETCMYVGSCKYATHSGGGEQNSVTEAILWVVEAVYFIHTAEHAFRMTPWQCSHRLVLRSLTDECSSPMFWSV